MNFRPSSRKQLNVRSAGRAGHLAALSFADFAGVETDGTARGGGGGGGKIKKNAAAANRFAADGFDRSADDFGALHTQQDGYMYLF